MFGIENVCQKSEEMLKVLYFKIEILNLNKSKA